MTNNSLGCLTSPTNSENLLDEITLYCEICNKPVCIIKESRPTSIHRVCCVIHE